MKKTLLLLLLVSVSSGLFSQETSFPAEAVESAERQQAAQEAGDGLGGAEDSSLGGGLDGDSDLDGNWPEETEFDSEYFPEDDPFADLFTEVEDVTVENQEPVVPAAVVESEPEAAPNLFYKPLTFSGHLEAEVGVAGEFQQGKADGTGFLLFKNDLYLSARATKNLGMKGGITVQFPNFALTVSELYFDYLLLDKVYISGGKKTINWGYVQLFNNMSFFDLDFHKVFETELKYIPTNILSDSGNMISLHVQVPVWTGTVSGVVLYPMRAVAPAFGDFSFAGSVEMTFWNTAFNLFARKNPSDDSDLSQGGKYRPPVVGLEVKRSLFATDVYAQTVVGVQNFKSLDSAAGYESVISTGGFSRLWDGIVPKVGVSFEYQHVYAPHGEAVHTHRTAFVTGLSSIGPRKNMKVVLTWNHRYILNDGELKLGFVASGVLPHADWKVGLDMNYGGEFKPVPKFTLATSVVLILDY